MKILVLLALFAMLLPGFAQAPSGLLRAGFPVYAFSGVELNDAEVSSSFYLKKMTESVGMRYQSRIYKDKGQLREDMISGLLDFVMLTPPDLSDPEIEKKFEPILVPVRGEVATEKFVLLVHRDSNLNTPADLAGKNLLMFSGSDSVLEFNWLDRELAKAGLPPSKQHFKTIEYPQGATKSVLPVFFRKADACLVSESVFTLISKLNPQVKQRLIPLLTSEELLTTVLAIRRGYSMENREKLIKIASSLNDSTDGKQILLLTKIDRVVLFEPGMMESSMALVTKKDGAIVPAKEGTTTSPE